MDAARDEWRVERRRGKPRGLRRAATLFSPGFTRGWHI